MLYTEIVKNNLIQSFSSFDELKKDMYSRILAKHGTSAEKESGKLEGKIEVYIDETIRKFQADYVDGDTLWLWENNEGPFNNDAGYAVIRGEGESKEVVNLELTFRS